MSVSNSIIRRALDSGNPIIQGNRATFIWEGDSPPQFISDLTGWEDKPRSFKRISSTSLGKTLWSYSLTVPRDAYVEYAFYDPHLQEHVLDPLNGQTVSNGLGSRNNFFYMPETMPSPFSLHRADVRAGTLTRHRVDAEYLQEDSERETYLYKPPTSRAVPLLIVYDGHDYLQRGRLTTIVDNLIADKRIRPIAIAFLQNGRSRRYVEYFCSDATIAWMDSEVLPMAREHLKLLNINEHPGEYGVLGASAGGLMSMYTGLRMPEIFGKVLCQAAVFAIEDRDLAVVDLVNYSHARDIKVWMDVGTLDELLEENRRMYALLERKRYSVSYREFAAGHNYTAWRDDIWRGLEEMFPYVPR